MSKARLVLPALLLAALAPLPVAAKDLRAGKPARGVAVLSSAVPGDVSEEEVLTFAKECGIDLVVLDFAWITHHWSRTDLKAIDALSGKLEKAGVGRPSTYASIIARPSSVVTPSGAAAHSYPRSPRSR